MQEIYFISIWHTDRNQVAFIVVKERQVERPDGTIAIGLHKPLGHHRW